MDRWSGGGGGGAGRDDAVRLLGLAEKLLEVWDLVGSKNFAERAMEADPLLDGVDLILAVADVLLAAQRRINNHVDWYAILQLDPSSDGRDPSAVKRQYRRLALLIHPDRISRPISGADHAFKLVSEAWVVLSDPAKKVLYDKELDIAAAAATVHLKSNGRPDHHATKKVSSSHREGSATSFWTACSHCFYVFQYSKGYEDRSLQCQNCQKVFKAAELPSPPPIVPGTEMYYCSWGLFPLGYPGGPNFGGAIPAPPHGGAEWETDAGGSWRQPPCPWWGTHHSQSRDQRDGSVNAADRNKESQANETVSKNMSKSPRKKKKMAAKKPRKQAAVVRGWGTAPGREPEKNIEPKDEATADIGDGVRINSEAKNVNKEVGCSENVGVMGEAVDLNFTIDIDGTDEILENLSSIPFLKDDEIVIIN